MSLCDSIHCGHSGADHADGPCTGTVTDFYGTWGCLCVGFVRDGDG